MIAFSARPETRPPTLQPRRFASRCKRATRRSGAFTTHHDGLATIQSPHDQPAFTKQNTPVTTNEHHSSPTAFQKVVSHRKRNEMDRSTLGQLTLCFLSTSLISSPCPFTVATQNATSPRLHSRRSILLAPTCAWKKSSMSCNSNHWKNEHFWRD